MLRPNFKYYVVSVRSHSLSLYSYVTQSDKLVDQVNEYKQIQLDIKTDLRSKIQQTLLSVFMKSDRDEDFVIGPDEVNRLVYRLRSIPSVEFDEAKFRKALEKEGGDISKFADRYFSSDARMQKNAIFKY
jgi:hypothetical protein